MNADLGPAGVHIRVAQPHESETILRLWSGLVDYHKSIERVRPQRWSGGDGSGRAGLLAEVWLDPDRKVVFLAELGDIPVGFVRASLTDDGPCAGRIDTLFVTEEARGRHIGASLLERACAWCREHGAGEVSVDFIAPNDVARGFYEHAGFQSLLFTHIRRV